MRKPLLLAGALLALGATRASAEGINLSWDDCGLFGTQNKSFACNTNTGAPFTLIGSFAPPGGLTEFLGIQADLGIVTTAATLPDWWRHGSTQCRGTTGLSTSFDFTSGPFSCLDFFAGQAIGSFAYDIEFPTPDRARLRIIGDVPFDNRGPIDEGTEYYAFKVNLQRAKTTGTGSCVGCAQPACIVLNQIQLFQPPGLGNDPIITQPLDRAYATWQSAPQPICVQTCVGYRDADGDGYGDPSVSINTSCPLPVGYVLNASDCDDTRASVHPGAPEVCDGMDNNCNAAIDENLDNVVGWWKGEGNANDAAGSNHGALQSGATFGGGKVGQCFSLDGIDDHIANLGTASTFSFIQNTGVFTIESWIKLNDPDAIREQAITANTPTTIEKGHYFTWDNSTGQQKLVLALMKAESGNPVIQSASPAHVITNSDWHHVAAVGNGSGITFYVDGTAYAGTGVMGSRPTGDAARAVDIGHCPAGSPQCQFGGLIDELAIHNRALGGSEIRYIYYAGSEGRCSVVAVDEPRSLPPQLAFGPVYPNPASHGVDFEIRMPAAGNVTALVVDIAGRRVSTLFEREPMAAGSHRLRWEGRDASGARVVPGVYLLRVTAGSGAAVQRIVMVK